MDNQNDITKKRVPFSWAQFIAIIFFAVSSTFALTKIYDRFELLEAEHHAYEEIMNEALKTLDSKIEENDVAQTRRLDTKTGRNAEAIEKLQGKVGK